MRDCRIQWRTLEEGWAGQGNLVTVTARPDFGENSEGGGKQFRGGAAVWLTTPMES
jgi:hypothetical protein